MKKKIKDLTIKEMNIICRKYINGECVNCPLYFGSNDFDCFCYFDAKNIENEEIEVGKDLEKIIKEVEEDTN